MLNAYLLKMKDRRTSLNRICFGTAYPENITADACGTELLKELQLPSRLSANNLLDMLNACLPMKNIRNSCPTF
jgi:hypothetical protein